MRPLHLIQIFHPSGKLFEAFEAFADLHPHASLQQSGTYFKQLLQHQENEPILLLAIQAEKLKDPGRWEGKEEDRGEMMENGRKRLEDGEERMENGRKRLENGKERMENGRKRLEDRGKRMEDDKRVSVDGSLVAGSLLGVIVKKALPGWMRFWPLSTLHERCFSRTIVHGGPLLAPGSRLEQETTLGLLVEELQRKSRRRSRYTQYRNLYESSEFLPKFRSMGFRISEGSTPSILLWKKNW